MSTEKITTAVRAIMTREGIRIESTFVPFSASRNAKEKSPSLNWKVRIVRGFISTHAATEWTDYSAGCAHCPAYKAKGLGLQNSILRDEHIRRECATGKTSRYLDNIGTWTTGAPIPLDDISVLHALISDCDVLNTRNFEAWASEFGYDEDSRKAEAIYDACLRNALDVKACIGASVMNELREALNGY